jgi:hypothetical protein
MMMNADDEQTDYSDGADSNACYRCSSQPLNLFGNIRME